MAILSLVSIAVAPGWALDFAADYDYRKSRNRKWKDSKSPRQCRREPYAAGNVSRSSRMARRLPKAYRDFHITSKRSFDQNATLREDIREEIRWFEEARKTQEDERTRQEEERRRQEDERKKEEQKKNKLCPGASDEDATEAIASDSDVSDVLAASEASFGQPCRQPPLEEVTHDEVPATTGMRTHCWTTAIGQSLRWFVSELGGNPVAPGLLEEWWRQDKNGKSLPLPAITQATRWSRRMAATRMKPRDATIGA